MISRVLAAASFGSMLVLPRLAVAACEIVEQGSVAFAERVRDIEVVGNLAYVAAGFDGLQILDVSVASAPVVIGSLATSGYSQDVEVAGNVAYVAESAFEGDGGLRIVNVANPALPFTLGHLAGSFSRVDLSGSLAFATEPTTGLHVIFVAFGPTPLQLGFLDLPGLETDVKVADGLAYVSVDGGSLGSSVHVVDASNPTAPLALGSLGTGGRLPLDVEVTGSVGAISAIGTERRGLILGDVSNPAAPVELAFLHQPSARDVRLVADRAYLAYGVDISFGGGPGGLRVVDIADPGVPVEIGGVDTTIDESASLAVVTQPDGDYVYVSLTGPNSGIRIFRVADCPDVLSLDVLPASPNNAFPLGVETPLPVQIFGSAALDVGQISLASLAFGPGAAPHLTGGGYAPTFSDVNFDGFADLTVWFSSSAAGLGAGDQQVCVDGLLGGYAFVGCDWVSPNQPPVANAFIDPNGASAPMLAVLDGSKSVDPEGAPLTYFWEFEGGFTSTNAIVNRLYPDPGIFTATLTVTDDFGQQSELQVELEVSVAVPSLGAAGLAGLGALLLGAGMRRLRRARCTRPAL